MEGVQAYTQKIKLFTKGGMLWSGICNSCNMGMSDLPDMYAQSPRAESIHIPYNGLFSKEFYFRIIRRASLL